MPSDLYVSHSSGNFGFNYFVFRQTPHSRRGRVLDTGLNLDIYPSCYHGLPAEVCWKWSNYQPICSKADCVCSVAAGWNRRSKSKQSALQCLKITVYLQDYVIDTGPRMVQIG